MTAKESRKIADDVNVKKHQTQKKDVYDLIKSTRANGGYQCQWYVTLMSAVRDELISDGYNVETSSHRNEITVTIQW